MNHFAGLYGMVLLEQKTLAKSQRGALASGGWCAKIVLILISHHYKCSGLCPEISKLSTSSRWKAANSRLYIDRHEKHGVYKSSFPVSSQVFMACCLRIMILPELGGTPGITCSKALAMYVFLSCIILCKVSLVYCEELYALWSGTGLCKVIQPALVAA